MSPEVWWAVVGLVMVIADLIFGTFFILFVGAGALITALFVWVGIIPDPTWQWVLFAVSSTLGLVLFRKKLVDRFGRGGEDKYNEHIGQKVVVAEEIHPNRTGKVSYRGALWIAKSSGDEILPVGKSVTIAKADGIILEVRSD